MKVLIVGGLGYIGSDLSPKLAKLTDVTILDNDMFSSTYHPEEDIEFINQTVLSLDNANDYDKIIILSDIDCEQFYGYTHYHGYLLNYQKKLIEIAASKAEVYYVHGYLDGELAQKQFVLDTIEKMSESVGGTVTFIKTPDLYGDNINVRGDTIINRLIREFLTQKKYVLRHNAAEMITFAHIFQFVDDLVECVMNDRIMPQYDRLPALMLVNMVHWSMEDCTKYEITMTAIAADIGAIEPTSIRYTDTKLLKYNVNMMMSAIEQGLSDALLLENSDREHILLAAMTSYHVTAKLLSP